jgi:peptidoglycan/LPS O-acetylase OafA/YrhL
MFTVDYVSPTFRFSSKNASRSGYERFIETRRFGSLDGLRAIAIAAVVWHHAGWAHSVTPGWAITTRGFLGVDLFFVISGFLIVTLLLREESRTNTISLSNFYARRFLRIFPPYYLMLLIVGTIAYLKPNGSTSDAVKHDLPYALLFVSNLFVMHTGQTFITWSLSVEEQFYAFIPAIMKSLGRWLPLFLLAAYGIACLPPFFPSLPLPRFFMETTFGPILLGAILACVLNSRRGFDLLSPLLCGRFAPLIAFGATVALLNFLPLDLSGWPRMMIHWATAWLVAACVVRENNTLAPVLTFWPIQRIGAVSYGIYLYHMLILHFVVMRGEVGLTSWFLTLASTWILAEMSYHFYEARFLSLKSRFGEKARAPAQKVSPEN